MIYKNNLFQQTALQWPAHHKYL